jgi:hypothetical protein
MVPPDLVEGDPTMKRSTPARKAAPISTVGDDRLTLA